MNKRTRITAGALALMSLLLLLWMFRPAPEPLYKGKPLSHWAKGHLPRSDANPPYESPAWLEADKALREIGTNGIPVLLDMLRAKDPPKFVFKLMDFTQQHFMRINYRSALARHEEAEYAFRLLGTNATCAVPGLIKIYEQATSPSSQMCAALALASIGQPAQAAIPVLLKNLTHTNNDVRFYAVSALCRIRGEPSIMVPALVRLLKDPKPSTRYNAISALINYGQQARSAIPDLVQATEDPATKSQAETALWYLAPEKIARTLVIEDATPIIAAGRTTEDLSITYAGERRTMIRAGTPVPCSAQFWDSSPVSPIYVYRTAREPGAKDHFLGAFEVLGIPAPPASANVAVRCIIADQQIFMNARDNRSETFLEIRRSLGTAPPRRAP